MEVVEAKKRRVKKRKMNESFGRYYKKLTSNSISCATVKVMDSFMDDIFNRIMSEASLLCRRGGKKTLAVRDIQSATKLVLPGELAPFANKKGRIAVRRWWRYDPSSPPESSDDSSSVALDSPSLSVYVCNAQSV
jgi:histone H2B